MLESTRTSGRASQKNLTRLAPTVRPIAVFNPLPWQVTPWRDTSPVLLLTGSAGGGKSRLASEKLHGYCLRYRGATALMLRKTRQSMTNSTVLFIERQVIGRDAHVHHYPSKHRFEYYNGSILAYGGMADDEQREQVRGVGQDGGVDIIWMEESTQFDEADYNELLARNRAKAAPWRQIVLTTNPEAPTHWIYRRMIQAREASVYYSHESDNKYNPEDYKTTLGKLTGIEHSRLVEGQWAQASGIVYDTWADSGNGGNVTEASEYLPDGGSILWAIDDGYSAGSKPATRGIDPATGQYVSDSHPRVILLCQQRDDGRIVVFAESYACLRLSDEHIAETLALPYPAPDFAVHGPGSAEIRGRLQAADIPSRQSTANVDESIKELRNALAPDGNGWRRIIVNPNCRHLRAEMVSCAYDPGTGKVVKAFDHGPDAIRGLTWILRHER